MNTSNIKNSSGIYIFTNKLNGKKYVGESVDIKERLMKYRYPKPMRAFEHALIKYGVDGFDLEIVYFPHHNKNDLIEIERLLIREYDCLVPYGYNICEKGTDRTGIRCSDETKEKLMIANKGKTYSDETKKKKRDSMMGKSCSEDTKKKISLSNTGRTRSDDAKKKMSGAKLGKPRDLETRQKISDFQKNRVRKPHSEATKQKISETFKKKRLAKTAL
jgi:group I intron endonuclease